MWEGVKGQQTSVGIHGGQSVLFLYRKSKRHFCFVIQAMDIIVITNQHVQPNITLYTCKIVNHITFCTQLIFPRNPGNGNLKF